MIPPAARSAEEFPVQTAQTEDIFRVASYHRKDFPLAVVRLNPRETDPHWQSFAAPVSRPPKVGLGNLESLPLEILCEIGRLLDLAAVFRLGQVNRCGREVTAAIPEYRIVAKHALDALRVVFRTGLAPHFTVVDLYDALCTKDCPLCGEFGGFVFLPMLRRCCFSCIQFSPKLQVLTLARLRSITGLTEAQLRRAGVPIIRAMPGTYTMKEMASKRLLRLVATRSVTRIFNHAEPPQANPDFRVSPRVYRFMAATALPFVNPRTLEVQHGISCKGCQIAVEKNLIEHSPEDYALRDWVYSKEGFINHFTWCAEAQALWISSQDGTVPVEEPESTRRGGYFSVPDDSIPS